MQYAPTCGRAVHGFRINRKSHTFRSLATFFSFRELYRAKDSSFETTFLPKASEIHPQSSQKQPRGEDPCGLPLRMIGRFCVTTRAVVHVVRLGIFFAMNAALLYVIRLTSLVWVRQAECPPLYHVGEN